MYVSVLVALSSRIRLFCWTVIIGLFVRQNSLDNTRPTLTGSSPIVAYLSLAIGVVEKKKNIVKQMGKDIYCI